MERCGRLAEGGRHRAVSLSECAGYVLNVSESARLKIAETIASDAAFLAKVRLVDYSLLLGVVNQASSDSLSGSPHRGCSGELYYLGVIDVLERWGPRWAFQGLLLKILFRFVLCQQWYNPEGITAIHPSDYAARFVEFMQVHLLHLPVQQQHTANLSSKSWQPFW